MILVLISFVLQNDILWVDSKGVSPPQILIEEVPDLPSANISIRGFVVLDALFSKEGRVQDIQIVTGLGKEKFSFEESAILALTKWKFSPATFNGKKIDVRMRLKCEFCLKNNCQKYATWTYPIASY